MVDAVKPSTGSELVEAVVSGDKELPADTVIPSACNEVRCT